MIAASGGTPAHAQDGPGSTADAMPGLHRVGVVTPTDPDARLALDVGYGFTEALGEDDGPHHRVAGALGLSVSPARLVRVALRLDGRWDGHPDDDLGSDDGFLGQPRLSLRIGDTFGDLRLGVEASVAVPGEDAPSLAFDALILDGRLLAAWAPQRSPWVVAMHVGYRLDRSAAALDEPQRLRRGDRIAIGLSDFDAALMGVGVGHRLGSTLIFAEATWDLLLGGDAPRASQSPLRATVGGRFDLAEGLALEARAEASLSGRPEVSPTAPMIPIEPRVSAWLGVRCTLPFSEPPAQLSAEGRGPPSGPAETPPPAEPAEPAEPTEPAEPEMPAGQLRGLVRSFDGEPLSARIVIDPLGIEVRTDAEGFFEVDVPPGAYRVTIEARGHGEQQRQVTVEENGVTILNADLRRARGR